MALMWIVFSEERPLQFGGAVGWVAAAWGVASSFVGWIMVSHAVNHCSSQMDTVSELTDGLIGGR